MHITYQSFLIPDEHDCTLAGSEESDDTASTISTVVDNFSIHSSNDPTKSNASTVTSTELANALKSFTMLEQEFTVVVPETSPSNPTKLEECLMQLQPPISFQDDSTTNAPANTVSTQMRAMELPVVDLVASSDYENVEFRSKVTGSTYENVIVNLQNKAEPKSISPKTPPTPRPRSASSISPKSPPPSLIPVPRSKTTVTVSKSNPLDQQIDSQESKVATEETDDWELPRLIKFVPKVVSTTPVTVSDKQSPITVNNNNNTIDPEPCIIKKCIKINSDDDDHRYVDSSSDEDEEKSYTLNGGQMTRLRHSSGAEDSSDTPSTSDEDGEKLGPPALLEGPGSSEAYFNFHWSSIMLPTIGEVEEEFSSLEHQPNG